MTSLIPASKRTLIKQFSTKLIFTALHYSVLCSKPFEAPCVPKPWDLAAEESLAIGIIYERNAETRSKSQGL